MYMAIVREGLPSHPQVPREPHRMGRRRALAMLAGGAVVAVGGAVLGSQVFGDENSSGKADVSFVPQADNTNPINADNIGGTSDVRVEPTVVTPKTGYSEQDGNLIYRTESGEVLTVPQIDGLTARMVKDGEKEEVQYFARERNVYGLEANGYAGCYKPNVDIYENSERKALGGVVLSPQVAGKLLNDVLSQIPEQKDKWMVVLPVDITDMRSDKELLLSFENASTVPVKIARLSFQDTLPVVDIIPGDKTVKFSKSPYYSWLFIDNIRTVAPYGEGIYPGKEMNYIGVSGEFTTASDQKKIESYFGNEVTQAEGRVNVSLSSANGSRDVTRDKILSVGDNRTPVFLTSTQGK